MCPTCQTFTDCPTHETTACPQYQNRTLKTEQCPEERALSADIEKLIVHNYILYAVVAVMTVTIVGLVAGLIYYKRQAEKSRIKSDIDMENQGKS